VTLLLASGALAQQPTLPRFELERLELNPSGAGSLVVGTGELLRPGSFRLSLAGHYEHDPLVFYINGVRQGAVVSDRVMAHVLAAWAPLSWFELGVQLPVVLLQQGDDLRGLGVARPGGLGLSTPSVSARLGLLSQRGDAPLDLALELGLGLPLGSAEVLGLEEQVRLTPRVMVGRSFGLLRAGVDASVLVRPTLALNEDANIQDEIGSELRLGAVVATTGEGLRGELSVRGGMPFHRGPSALELLAGARLPVGEALEVYALAGPGFGIEPGTPSFRALLGVAYGTAPRLCVPGGQHAPRDCPDLDDDADGVKNGADACPTEGGRVDAQGCPSKDGDGDGVPDSRDLCPAVAGRVEDMGCPPKDTDKDGVLDAQDACLSEAGPADRQGCPVRDTDGDGLEDKADRCPTEPGTAERQGCAPKDTDKDGVLDERDACPTEAGLAEVRGCPAKDTDKDGVADHLDNCLEQAGPADNQGCPAQQKQMVAIQKGRLDIQGTVYFATGKSVIQPRSFPLLDQVAKVLREHPEIERIRIEGHTDDRGKADANRSLSQARAEAVQKYLVDKGVEAARLEAKGFGPDRPVTSNKTEKGRAANRRVEFVITSPEGEPQQ
jgi:outer membrane protein OmpA-like peptidoglycan-associated protein